MSYHELFKRLASLTQARINLGHTGGGLPTKPLLSFRLDHALARDAVYKTLDTQKLQDELLGIGLTSRVVNSKASNRETYLKRPDLGRSLHESSREIFKQNPIHSEICLIIADGLSATAVQSHAIPLINNILPLLHELCENEIIIVNQGRVAIADEIGELCGAKMSIILIGERPGLSSPDSMGIYLTYQPQVGNTDEKRNCISNVRNHGLPYAIAAQKLSFLVRESLRLKISGVNLSEDDHSLNSLNP